MTCFASGLGPCTGAVSVDEEGVPMCAAHRMDIQTLTGPWRTDAGRREWLACMRSVWQARTLLDGGRVVLEQPSGGAKRAPWIDWSDPASRAGADGFKWIGGSPGWDSSDDRLRWMTVEAPQRKPRETLPDPK